MQEQSFKNHTKWDWRFHFFLTSVLVVLIGEATWRLWNDPGIWGIVHLLYAIAAFMAVLLIRVYALKVQDRVIRLEERLRMQSLLPESLRARVADLDIRQIVALRFASDAELPGLVEKALSVNMSEKDIKQSIRSWRADFHRV